ncbi:DeoR/GlpR transcriptional regulator [Peribacillus cavernae]|uniref:DeoR/GlpR transcriptional regulator n=1 Tax=Peribacillus cavernae TaxID=1674310 RepID=A0A433HK31_9BACI|nr:DeoR/GlpR family DNA-binding transcription regulator [Peribacillus cavernae]MDQ0219214.1 DeoR family glycerol-3-phosphate regulon repressor [Peribacillus cavernae]RUQ28569.1 DeoR/GlpR transcriptional regulator [Peribacillus cavernae]
MLAHDRHEKIMDLLGKNKSLQVSSVTKIFGVSTETIRRDLEHLEKEGHLRRVRGGAVLDDVNSKEINFTLRETKNIGEKREIAKIALRYVSEGQSIALDVSTTNTEFAKALKGEFQRLTIITNSLVIATELAEMPYYTIIMPGGVLRNEELCMVGHMAEEFFKGFHIDTFFMSISGISLTEGLTDYGIGEYQVKMKMLESSRNCLALADSSKFDVASLLKVCHFDRIDRIISDSKLSDKVLQKYAKEGIEIVNE